MKEFIVRIKRAETPFYALLKRVAKGVLEFNLPVPRIVRPLFRMVHACIGLLVSVIDRTITIIYRYPVTRSLCEEIGPGLDLEYIPGVSGPLKIWIGKKVKLSGKMAFCGARIFDQPKLVIGDRVFIGHGAFFEIAKEVVIEEDVLVAGDCLISDYSGHPVDTEQRIAGIQVRPESVRPVRICRRAWIGRRVIILPGVTVGEGAIVGAGTVVSKDVPPYRICVGSPARILPYSTVNQNSTTEAVNATSSVTE